MRTAREVYAMVENESLWQAAARCHEVLAAAEIPHAVVGGVAVCLHGYQRNTVDVDVLIRRVDSDAVRASLEREGFVWNAAVPTYGQPTFSTEFPTRQRSLLARLDR